jgi:hypothetical protein
MYKYKIALLLILLLSILFFNFPQEVVAEINLSERESHYLLNSAQQGIIDEWITITASSDFSNPEEQAALYLIRNSIQCKQLDYAFKDLPKEFLENTIKLVASFYFSPDVGTILEKMEKSTVQEAIDVATDWLLEKEIKTDSGKISYSFTSYAGNQQEPVFYYSLAYRSLNKKEGEVVIEFYSPEKVEPQESTIAGMSIRRSSWDFLGWRKKGNKEIEPFILRIEGKVSKKAIDRYAWQETLSVEVSFTDSMPPMPEIAPEEPFIAKLPIVGGYYKDLKNRIEKAETLINNVVGENSFQEEEKSIRSSIEGVGSKIKSYFSRINPFSASIVQSPPVEETPSWKTPPGSITEEDLEKINSFIDSKINSLKESFIEEALRKRQINDSLVKPSVDKEKDDLVEEIDTLDQEMNALVRIVKILEEEGVEEEKIKEIKKIIEEDEEQISVEEKNKGKEDDAQDILEEKGSASGIFCNKTLNDPDRDKVIINEVAWMGTKNSHYDEWIELKNISNDEINLENWQLLDKESQIEIVFEESDVISSGGLYLLERTDDDSVSSVDADFIYKGNLNNNNEGIYLFNEECVLKDLVVANPNWPAGSNEGKRSMERDRDLNWHTYYGVPKHGILGTPGQENSSPPANISFIPGPSGGEEKPEEKDPSEEEQSTSSLLDIVITEIQIEGEEKSHDFIELYNPNTTTVDISGFQLKKKTSSGNDYSIRLFPEGSIVEERSYFLWLNSSYVSSSQLLADVSSSQTLAINNSIALLNKKGDVMDAVAWGSSTNPFVEGEAFPQNPIKEEGLARKWNLEINNYQDQNNNKEDFEIQNPSPGEINSSSQQTAEGEEFSVLINWEPEEVFVGQEVLFSASSSCPGEASTSFLWNLGIDSATSSGATTSFTYASSTEYIIELALINSEGITKSSATTSLEVKKIPLEINPLSFNFQIEEGDSLEKQELKIINTGEEEEWAVSIDYSNTSTDDWIEIESTTGTIEANSSSSVKFNVDTSLEVGEYNATATIEFLENDFKVIPIGLTISELPEPILSVVINEISWAGTKADANDEWIELYNNTEEEIDLNGWKIESNDNNPEIILSGIVSPNSYFLLERTDDQVVSDIKASQIYTGSLENEGERLKLVDASSTLIDMVDCSDGWFGGRNRKINDKWIRMSMERVDPDLSGSDDSNWVTNDGIRISGKDKEENYIIGTPGQENSRYKFYSRELFYGGAVLWDVIWTAKGGPYPIQSTLSISEESTFIIEPGVEVELIVNRNSRIKVEGTLIAGDKEGEQVVFTSNLESAAPRLWNYIYFTGPDSVLENVVVENGGWYHRLPPFSVKGAVTIENTDIIIRDSVFRNNLVADIWLINSSSTIEDTSFEGPNKEYYYEPRGPGRGITVDIYLEDSNPVLNNLTFDENEVNIYPE